MLKRIFSLADKVFGGKVVYAHCDIPCGIYDPHTAQLSAHTVIRMDALIEKMPKIGPSPSNDEFRKYIHDLTRYTDVKEEHAEKIKSEVRILWGDYFKDDHAKQFPELEGLVLQALRLGSKVKQEVDPKSAQELLETINKIAEIFWKTKGIETKRVKVTFWPTDSDLVIPILN
jgi:nickel superoxide dismutase